MVYVYSCTTYTQYKAIQSADLKYVTLVILISVTPTNANGQSTYVSSFLIGAFISCAGVAAHLICLRYDSLLQ